MPTILLAVVALAAAAVQVTAAPPAMTTAQLIEWTQAAEAVQGPVMACDDLDRLDLEPRVECEQ